MSMWIAPLSIGSIDQCGGDDVVRSRGRTITAPIASGTDRR